MGMFGDLFGAITGQQKTAPYNPLDVGQTLQQSAGQAAAANLAYNQAYAPGIFDLQLGLEKKYDPNIANLRAATSKSIGDQLALGSNLPEDVKQLITQNALQSGAASGFGLSPGGRGLVAKDLGLTSLDLLNQRQGTAANYVRSAPQLNQLYQPLTAFNPQGVLDLNVSNHNIENERAANDFYTNEGNKIAMFNTFGRVAGGVAGGIFGGSVGANIGMNVGGSLIQNPYRAGSSGGGGGGGLGMGGGSNPFSALLSQYNFGSLIGGPQYGIGGSGGMPSMGSF